MSQSDYIQHKKIANILRNRKLENVVSSQLITEFKTFVFSNSTYDESVTPNQLVPPGMQLVFGMEMEVDRCPLFIFCNHTNLRPHRQQTVLPMFSNSRAEISKDGFFWNQKMKELLCLEKEFKQCDEYLYRKRLWFKR